VVTLSFEIHIIIIIIIIIIDNCAWTGVELRLVCFKEGKIDKVVPLRSIEAHLGDRKLQDGGEN
jgi:hypothetical protein